jgi:hypothetical protein
MPPIFARCSSHRSSQREMFDSADRKPTRAAKGQPTPATRLYFHDVVPSPLILMRTCCAVAGPISGLTSLSNRGHFRLAENSRRLCPREATETAAGEGRLRNVRQTVLEQLQGCIDVGSRDLLWIPVSVHEELQDQAVQIFDADIEAHIMIHFADHGAAERRMSEVSEPRPGAATDFFRPRAAWGMPISLSTTMSAPVTTTPRCRCDGRLKMLVASKGIPGVR